MGHVQRGLSEAVPEEHEDDLVGRRRGERPGSWDKKGIDAGSGSWRTDFTYNPRVLLATGGDTITAVIHQFVKKEFSDGAGGTYAPGTDLWAGLISCTVHAV